MITTENAFFNFWKNEAITLEEGEEVCSECKGDGVRGMAIHQPPNMNPKNICSKCNGEGKLDWCEKVVGKPPLYGYSSSPSSSSLSAERPKYGRKEDSKRRRNYLSKMQRKRRNRRWMLGRGIN